MRLLWFNLATDADDAVLGFTTAWLRSMAGRVDAIDVITMRAGRIEVPGNVRVYSVGKERGHGEARRLAEFYRILTRLTSSRRYDACFAHMMPLFAVLAAPLLLPRRVPITVWYTHPTPGPVLRIANRVATHAVSSTAESYPVSHEKLIVTGHGIDTTFFQPAPDWPRRPGLELAVIGRVSRIKRVDAAIDAARRLFVRGRSDARLKIVGPVLTADDARYAETLRHQTTAAGLDGAVDFVGAVPYSAMPAVYQSADIVVSLNGAGSFDKVVLEAMSCGTPALSCNPGFASTFGDLTALLLLRSAEPDEIVDRIVALSDRLRTDRDALASTLHERAAARHGLDRLMDTLVRDVLRPRGSNPAMSLPS